MTAKLLSSTDKLMHHSTYRALTPKELTNLVEQDHTKAFLRIADDGFGTCLNMGELEEVELADTTDPQPYADVEQNKYLFPVLGKGRGGVHIGLDIATMG